MRVECLHRNASSIGAHWSERLFPLSIDYSLRVGGIYTVYAVRLIEEGAMLLLLDDSDNPGWYPFDSFAVVDDDIPWGWKIGKIEGHSGGMYTILGYPEMVEDEDHHDLLLEGDVSAFTIFSDYVKQYAVDD